MMSSPRWWPNFSLGTAYRCVQSRTGPRLAEIAKLDLSGVAVIALTYVELFGSPAQLRYLIKRLRQRAPDATIIVGLWAEGEAILNKADLQNMISADGYVSTLRQMIDVALGGEELNNGTQAVM